RAPPRRAVVRRRNSVHEMPLYMPHFPPVVEFRHCVLMRCRSRLFGGLRVTQRPQETIASEPSSISSRIYSIQPEQGYFEVGVTGGGRQVLMGLYFPALVAILLRRATSSTMRLGILNSCKPAM